MTVLCCRFRRNMDTPILLQSTSLLRRLRIEILEGGLGVSEWTPMASRRYFISFHDLPDPPEEEIRAPRLGLAASFLLPALGWSSLHLQPAAPYQPFLALLMTGGGLIAAFLTRRIRSVWVHLSGARHHLAFRRDRPTLHEVDEFLNALQEQHQNWFNSSQEEGWHDPLSGLERLQSLRERGALTEEEFQTFKHQLLYSEPPEPSSQDRVH